MASQGTSGPDQRAWEWLESIRAQDTRRVWRLMEPDFRLVMAQGWITHNPEALDHPTVAGLDQNAFARELATEESTHPLWRHCARVSLREITQAYDGLEQRDLRIGTRTRLIGPDLELVRFFPVDELDQDEDGQYYLAPGKWAHSFSVLLRHGEPGWQVA
jgi:hypothetical protein